MQTLLECSHVYMQYDKFAALEDVSFAVQKGDFLCVVGENGSGKSSLLKCILGLHPKKSGEIRFCPGMTNKQVGYLPQQSAAQHDFPAHVAEVVRSGRLNRGGFNPFYSGEDRRAAQSAMELLRIQAIRRKSYRELSGGQQQRVLLARALCAAKELLLLDEPVTGLDPVVTAEFYELVAQLNRAQGMSVIMVSHDVHAAVRSANKILHLSRSVSFFGSTLDYQQSHIGQHFMRGCCSCD